MSMLGLLPQRWRTQPGDPHRAEDLAGVLETPPMAASGTGLVLCLQVGTQDLLPGLVALKSLLHRLGRGRCVVHDAGDLIGSDRTIIAHHLGDPPIVQRGGTRLGGFPKGEGWEPLLDALDGRRSEYWLLVDPHCVALGPVDEIASAIAGNRSLHGPGLLGLAAGGPGRPDPQALLAAMVERRATPHAMLLLREAAAVELPAMRYRACPAKKDLPDCALATFGKRGTRAASAHAEASSMAIAALSGAD